MAPSREGDVAGGDGTLLLVTALALEAGALVRRLGRGDRGALTVAIVGPGAVRLAPLDAALGAAGPRALLVAGLGGGCTPGLGAGDLVVGDPVGLAGPDPGWRSPDPGLRARALDAAEAAGLRYRVGRLLTVEGVVPTAADKAACWAVHGALAVDMESARVLAWAARAGLPALAVRAVADEPDEALPAELLAAVDREGRLRASGVAGLLRRPGLVESAWRLGRRSRRALACLARFLHAFLAPAGRP